MSFNHYICGKSKLNQHISKINLGNANLIIHYWGGLPEHHNSSVHKHSFFEVCLVLDGEGSYSEETEIGELRPYTLFFSRPDIEHQIKSEHGLAILYIGFEWIESESSEKWIDTMKELAESGKPIVYLKKEDRVVWLWKQLFVEATRSKQLFFNEVLHHLASYLLLSILSQLSPVAEIEEDLEESKPYSTIMRQAKLYIRDNLASPLRLEGVAEQLHISSRHLSRLFETEMNTKFTDFLNDERIQKATEMLKTTDLTVSDIAQHTGFTSIHYFSRVFSHRIGSSPKQFRQLYKETKMIKYSR